MYIRYLLLLVLLLNSGLTFAQKSLRLWYKQPAVKWEETLALGNGRLGMMPDGGIFQEKVVMNDITLWSGSSQDANNYDAYKSLPEIRRLIAAGKNDEAQALVNRDFICKGEGSGGRQFGCFQMLGELQLDFNYEGPKTAAIKTTRYERELSLGTAVATTRYQLNGVNYTRTYFCSFDGDISIIRLTADQPGKLNFKIGLSRPERGEVTVVGKELRLAGRLDNGTDGKGMQYQARLNAALQGGTLTADKQQLIISNATSVTLYMSMGTDFKNPEYLQRIDSILKAAVKKDYVAEKDAHTRKYQQMFNRLNIQLGVAMPDQLPTDERLANFHKNPEADPGFVALFYQFGRYLSISSTRVGLLPPNLQGLWANQIRTPWNGDYHLDVNVQMNHWPVEVSNLSELNLPLAELVRGLVTPGQRTAKAYYQADGWIAHVITNIWGFTEPGESASWGASNAGSGWLCNNLWEHYAFTGDKNYLKSIYPILKGSAEFYNSALIKDQATGWLVTAPSVSPENSFFLPNSNTASISMGPTIDNQIVRELFSNVIAAGTELGVDKAFREVLAQKLKAVPPPGNIAKDGRVMEWLEDYKETDREHRHISHLYGLYPAALITPGKTPELAEAAKKTLNVRGDDGPGWTIAYKLLFWARLHDGERAYKLLTSLLRPTGRTDINYGAGGGIYPNLLAAGPPFQIDGNFGGAAGIAEMLIQSHDGYIELLPAIPEAWKLSGSVKGLKARGNFTVDMSWKSGKITSYQITSPKEQQVKVKVNGRLNTVWAKRFFVSKKI